MEVFDRVSTGMLGLDNVIDGLRFGDNVVWKVESVADYRKMIEPFVRQARKDRRKLVYMRFGSHEPLLPDDPDILLRRIDPQVGFESFASEVHRIVKSEGKRAFYVFDCLTDLLKYWYSDLMIGNFFKVTCPYLYELDTVAYFALRRNTHTFATIAGIRETTQLLLDLYQLDERLYVHPLKVWQRYSSTMFFPHLIREQEATSITSSAEVAELFSKIHSSGDRMDYWTAYFRKAKAVLVHSPEEQESVKRELMRMMFGAQSRMFDLCDRYFSLSDILAIASRELGTGFIGGKSIGMLIARKILEKDGFGRYTPYMESHDSYYLGSDVFYTYIVQNGWWRLHTKQRTAEGYYSFAPELRDKMLRGKFPKDIQEQFIQMLEYFGQFPIIVRSSSLLEDNFGNAFAGKYESVFCPNQGTPEERYEAFEQAVRTVYASTMNEDALAYRMNRGLFESDEQMAILVQRVSGDQYGGLFFPHVAGVGNSSNLYVWDKAIKMDAGMLRMVFGLGTRAVDRTSHDYVKIICLDDPLRMSPMDYEDRKEYSQHAADVISLPGNELTSEDLDRIFETDIKADKELFASQDYETARRYREEGIRNRKVPGIYDFKKLLKTTEFAVIMRDILALVSKVYNYPVDIEFAANFTPDGRFRINLLQCRPLQTSGLGKSVEMPDLIGKDDCFFSTKGSFMGGNVRLKMDYVIYVDPIRYQKLNEASKYSVARQIGYINTALKGRSLMLIGPGRWGTTTPSLGVPVHFSELCNMAVLCEVASREAGFAPELSYGSHFFQDLVETGIFYAAIFDGQKDVVFHPEYVLERENLFSEIVPEGAAFADVIRVIQTDDLQIYSDIVSQSLICK